ncbi:hypothetical protein GCM10007047_06640 [Cerasicoccus arenae]|uniref:DUF1146 domain-containing protein n=1 Tax=Cerasicoccus arenae TaxID=424488 RepID=A0A8J3D806_9BACT|nr:hypothetical protein GCM10007047_06640 [Cerasicoccus arenae]
MIQFVIEVVFEAVLYIVFNTIGICTIKLFTLGQHPKDFDLADYQFKYILLGLAVSISIGWLIAKYML